ncbi:MAG: TlpA disulfide reductase family protein [Burkholderiaceae bacterium]
MTHVPNATWRRLRLSAPLALVAGALAWRGVSAAGPSPAAVNSDAAAPAGEAAQASALPQVNRQSIARRERNAPALPAVGSPLVVPPITLLDGSVFDAGGLERVLVLYWWASTCPFCAVQSPFMQAFWETHRDRGLAMLALSIDKTPQAAADYLRRKGYNFPAAWADDAFLDAFPKPKGLPITIVRGRDQRVLQAERGQLVPEDVEEMRRWL